MHNNVTKIEKNNCYGCKACSNVCPYKCIHMTEDKDGFTIPKIDLSKCIECGLCLSVCPSRKNRNKIKSDKLKIYSAFNENPEIRARSTSGGVFYELARIIINDGGCVYGAAFNEKFEVIHICAENLNDVMRCMKSKYVQSDMNTVYRQISKRSQNQLVLFSGTPCQVAALSNYPNINAKNLFTVDLICHGVPSPKLWSKYLAEREEENGEIESLVTREKEKFGSTQSEVVIHFKNGKEYREILANDSYMKAFMYGYSLRNSCYHCRYKGKNRRSDITLADFIEADKYIVGADVFKGMSIVTSNTAKGDRIIEKLKSNIRLQQIFSKHVLLEDWTWGLSYPYSRKRDYFYQICFEENKTIQRSIIRADIWDKKQKSLYETITEKRDKLGRIERDAYYKYFFDLRRNQGE